MLLVRSGPQRPRPLTPQRSLPVRPDYPGYPSYQTLASRLDSRRIPRPGRLVSVGAFRLNLHCTGHGTPTVVLESGLADSLDQWTHIQPEIARFTRVCSYDRAGYGYSNSGPMRRTSARIASELRAALRAAGEKPSFLLVGHSFGGYNVRVVNGKYSDEVAGLVLVDATQEDQYRLLPSAWADMGGAVREHARRQAFWAPLYDDLGIARLQLRLQGLEVPPILLQSKYIKARTSELLSIEESAEQARAAGHISDKPLVVLTAGRPVDSSLKAVTAQRTQRLMRVGQRLATPSVEPLKTGQARLVISNSGHDIPTDAPDAIVSAVRELIAASNAPQ